MPNAFPVLKADGHIQLQAGRCRQQKDANEVQGCISVAASVTWHLFLLLVEGHPQQVSPAGNASLAV